MVSEIIFNNDKKKYIYKVPINIQKKYMIYNIQYNYSESQISWTIHLKSLKIPTFVVPLFSKSNKLKINMT